MIRCENVERRQYVKRPLIYNISISHRNVTNGYVKVQRLKNTVRVRPILGTKHRKFSVRQRLKHFDIRQHPLAKTSRCDGSLRGCV